MPELPEVETVARQLAASMPGRTIRGVRVYDSKIRLASKRTLRGRRIERVARVGKQVVFALSPRPGAAGGHAARPAWLCVHLRMTGRLIWCENGRAPTGRKSRLRLDCDLGTLFFRDVRRFGTVRLAYALEELEPTGVEPLSRAFTRAGLAEMLGRTPQALKVWLLRQDRLVGLGNIYAAEILFDCGIGPRRPANSLDADEVARLYISTRHILRQAIRHCGSTFSDFQDSRGDAGSYQRFWRVYGREGQACSRCDGVVERFVQAQRSTFFCGGCQK